MNDPTPALRALAASLDPTKPFVDLVADDDAAVRRVVDVVHGGACPRCHGRNWRPDGERWISCDDWQNSVYAYLRYGKNSQDFVVVVMNMTPVPRHNYRIGVPKPGFYSEIMNTDAGTYGGSNVGNAGGVYSEIGAMHGHGQNISLTIPPLGMLVLKPVVGAKASKPEPRAEED